MTFKSWLLPPIMCFVLFSLGLYQVLANNYKTGLDAYQAGQYEQAYKIWSDLASNNDVLSQFGLGVMYSEGKGVTRDYVISVMWYEKATAQAYSPAQYNLGNAYKFGRGVKQNNERAVHYWQMAASQDFAPAQNNLATALYFGRGIKQDKKKAEYWYRKAAAAGYKPASEKVALLDEPQPVNEKINPAGAAKSDIEKKTPEPQALTDFDKRLANDKKWILEQNSGSYTVQILASPLSSNIQSYLKEHKMLGTAKIFAFNKNNKQWYAILYGVHLSMAEAIKADNDLSATLKHGKGWVRKISAIQDILKKDI